jgi:hypothetical protein
MPDGTLPQPGGWNRFSLEVTDLEHVVAARTARARRFSGVPLALSAIDKAQNRDDDVVLRRGSGVEEPAADGV